MRILCAVSLLILFMSPRIIIAGTQSDQDHCTAAYHAAGNEGMITWRKTAAEDYDIQAAHQTWEAHGGALLMEAIDLVDLSMAEGLNSDTADVHYVAIQARSIFQEILVDCPGSRTRSLTAEDITHADGLIDLNKSL